MNGGSEPPVGGYDSLPVYQGPVPGWRLFELLTGGPAPVVFPEERPVAQDDEDDDEEPIRPFVPPAGRQEDLLVLDNPLTGEVGPELLLEMADWHAENPEAFPMDDWAELVDTYIAFGGSLGTVAPPSSPPPQPTEEAAMTEATNVDAADDETEIDEDFPPPIGGQAPRRSTRRRRNVVPLRNVRPRHQRSGSAEL